MIPERMRRFIAIIMIPPLPSVLPPPPLETGKPHAAAGHCNDSTRPRALCCTYAQKKTERRERNQFENRSEFARRNIRGPSPAEEAPGDSTPHVEEGGGEYFAVRKWSAKIDGGFHKRVLLKTYFSNYRNFGKYRKYFDKQRNKSII